MDWEDTIVGTATAPGDGARTILRISGPLSHGIAKNAIATPRQTAPQSAASPELTDSAGDWNRILVRDAVWTIAAWGREIDCQLYAWPRGRSYTGQQCVELHLPVCSAALTAAVERQILQGGARLAKPGEFTLRAFLSGRLDLAQAEGVLGLIEADSIEQLKQAIDRRSGGMSRPVAELRSKLLDMLADVEAGLDFVEEDIQFISDEQLLSRLSASAAFVNELLGSLRRRSVDDDVPSAALLGPPNAGKSSLLNALAGKQHALVSPVAGTTRDYLSARLEHQGIVFDLIDTAGVETADDSIGRQAQRQRRRILDQADLLLDCLPCDNGGEGFGDPERIRDVPRLLVRTKCDLRDEAYCNDDDGDGIFVSVYDPESIARLTTRIAATISLRRNAAERFANRVSQRCYQSLEQASGALADAVAAVENGLGHELAAVSIRESLDALGEIVGAVYTDDLLDKIFSKFCIGK